MRLWVAFHFYGQYPARYGRHARGWEFYFGNQSAAWAACADVHGTHACALRFEGRGRHLMTWHDGSFMRHTRFRYWLLDTMLRAMAPGVQRVFFRTRQASDACALESSRGLYTNVKLLAFQQNRASAQIKNVFDFLHLTTWDGEEELMTMQE